MEPLSVRVIGEIEYIINACQSDGHYHNNELINIMFINPKIMGYVYKHHKDVFEDMIDKYRDYTIHNVLLHSFEFDKFLFNVKPELFTKNVIIKMLKKLERNSCGSLTQFKDYPLCYYDDKTYANKDSVVTWIDENLVQYICPDNEVYDDDGVYKLRELELTQTCVLN